MELKRRALNSLEIALAGIGLSILLATILLSYQDWRLFRQASMETAHTRRVLDTTEALIGALKDAETGQRGFLITGEKRYLEPYENAVAVIPDQLQRLTTLTAAEPAQASRVKLLGPLISEKLAELKETIELRENQGIDAAAGVVRTDRGRRIMGQLRDLGSQIRVEEYANLDKRSRSAEIHGQRTRLFATFGSVVLFVFLIFGGIGVATTAVGREQLIEQLRASEARTAEVRDLLQTTLSSIGDAVIATDAKGQVTFINPVAQALTDYTLEQASGKPLDEVFRIVNESTRRTVESPVSRVLREGTVVGLANHTALISRNGREMPIDDSGAPIRGPQGSLVGVVLVFRDISARKKAEEESLRLAAIVDSSDDAIVAQQLDGVITNWNGAAERMFGYAAAEVVGRDFSFLIRQGSAEIPGSVLDRIQQGEPGVHYEAMLRRKDGSLVEASASVSPIRDAAGNIVGASRICRDITERRRAEEESLRLAAIVDSSDDAIVAQQLDGVITNWNAAAERMFGYSAAEVVGRNFSFLIPQGSPEMPGSVLDRIRGGEPAVHYEAMRQRKDGSLVEVSASVSPIRDPAGKVVGASRICRDITERRRTEEALRESEERLRLSAEAAQIGAWNNDLVARRVTWSPELERLVGLAPGSFRRTNEHVAQLLHPEDRDRALEAFNRAVERRADFDLECRIIRADGELRWLFVRGGPRYDASGAAVSMAGVAMDVTGRKQLEDKLRQSQKLESLGVLAGGVAHDFNNLLVGVIGNAGLLLEETPPESPRRQVIENLMEAGERAAQLTRQMLAYSGKGQFVIERLNLEQQVRQILALIAASIPKGVKIELDFAPDPPSVEGDAGQLQQLIMNLVINGAEAIGEGGGTVTISTRLREIDRDYVRDNLAGDNIPPGSYLVLEVHDNGIGMDAATQARIFDPFFTTKFTGRGLGLAAVLGIVRGHKGALTVYSEPGTGTTFKVFLPVASESVPATIEPSVLTEFQGQGTILVVDDEEVVQRTLKTSLERYGYQVVSAGGGEEATEILRQMGNGIALILLDMTMPGLSGEQTLKRLRAIRTDVPVIATSGYNEVEAMRRFGAGLSGFIQKPFTPRKLAEKIHRVLSP